LRYGFEELPDCIEAFIRKKMHMEIDERFRSFFQKISPLTGWSINRLGLLNIQAYPVLRLQRNPDDESATCIYGTRTGFLSRKEGSRIDKMMKKIYKAIPLIRLNSHPMQ
jgi:hypothetical protein